MVTEAHAADLVHAYLARHASPGARPVFDASALPEGGWALFIRGVRNNLGFLVTPAGVVATFRPSDISPAEAMTLLEARLRRPGVDPADPSPVPLGGPEVSRTAAVEALVRYAGPAAEAVRWDSSHLLGGWVFTPRESDGEGYLVTPAGRVARFDPARAEARASMRALLEAADEPTAER